MPVGRRFSDALYLAPGVSSGGQVGQANPSIAGGSGLENSYVVDGVNITNGGYGALGSYSIVFGSLGNGLPFDFMKSGAGEDRRLRGGVRPGHRRRRQRRHQERHAISLSGSLFGYFRPDRPRGERDAGPDDQRHREHHRHAARTTRAARSAARSCRTSCSSSARSTRSANAHRLRRAERLPAAEPRTGRRRIGASYPYAAKATWQATPAQRIDVSFFGDPAHGDLGPQRYTVAAQPGHRGLQHARPVRRQQPDACATKARSARAGSSKARSRAPRTTSSRSRRSISGGDRRHRDAATAVAAASASTRPATRAPTGSTRRRPPHHRRHQIRYGIDAEHLDYINTINRTGPTFTLPDGDQTATGAEIEILPDATYGTDLPRRPGEHEQRAPIRRRTTRRSSSQDTWKVGSTG